MSPMAIPIFAAYVQVDLGSFPGSHCGVSLLLVMPLSVVRLETPIVDV